jgi:hypothetical protein
MATSAERMRALRERRRRGLRKLRIQVSEHDLRQIAEAAAAARQATIQRTPARGGRSPVRDRV